ncbi:unnamed protein product [Brassica oleracea var. botrytis]
MESEFQYSSNTNSLAPVVDPHPEFDLPFEVLFKSNRVFREYQQFHHKEQLVVLQESWVNGPALEIWITNKIDQDAVSWSKLLRSISIFNVDGLAGSFFIDEESCCDCRSRQWWTRTEIRYNQRANIIGHDEYFKSVNMGEALNHRKHNKFVFVLPVF